MTYDKQSTELAAVVSSGQKVSGKDMGGKIRRAKFTGVVLLDGETGQLTNKMPPGSEVIGAQVFADSGTGTIAIKGDGGTTVVAAGLDPTATAVVDHVAVGNEEIYAEATGIVTIHGWITYVAGA